MKRMLFNATQAEELRVAIVDGQKLIDLDIESAAKEERKSNIYKAVITRIEPSLEAAFVDYGSERHGFLPFKEIARSYHAANPDGGKARIQDALSVGQELIVQVEKDERGNKGAALTTYISLAGRYLVLMPNNPRGGGVSRRVEGEERAELREIMDQLETPAGTSLIARTAAIGRTAEELQWDLNYLLQLWQAIEGAATSQTGAFLIYQEGSLVIRAIRDYFQPDIGEILIDTDDIHVQACQFMAHVMPDNVVKVKRYSDDVPLFSRFQIEHQIESAYARQVSLPSGGAIVIDHTEALVSIDVNSGRATKGSDIEETALRTNCEAAEEVARQLRLRDLGGLVVIDFIDMESQKNQREVENRLKEALHHDRARVQTGRISRFGLLELSRQRLRPALAEASYEPCPRCTGTGHIRNIESSALHILRILEEEAMKENTGAVHVQVPVSVATFLLNEKRTDIARIEMRHRVQIVIVPNRHFETPQYDIVRLRHDQLDSEEAVPASYQMAAEPAPDETRLPSDETARPARPEALVKGIAPSRPAPAAPASTPEAPATSHDKGLLSRLFGWLQRPAAESTPETPDKPAAKPQRQERRNGESRRGNRGRQREEPQSEEQNRRGRNQNTRHSDPAEETPSAGNSGNNNGSNGSNSGRGRRGRGRGRESRPEDVTPVEATPVKEKTAQLESTSTNENKAPEQAATSGESTSPRRRRRRGRRGRGGADRQEYTAAATPASETTTEDGHKPAAETPETQSTSTPPSMERAEPAVQETAQAPAKVNAVEQTPEADTHAQPTEAVTQSAAKKETSEAPTALVVTEHSADESAKPTAAEEAAISEAAPAAAESEHVAAPAKDPEPVKAPEPAKTPEAVEAHAESFAETSETTEANAIPQTQASTSAEPEPTASAPIDLEESIKSTGLELIETRPNSTSAIRVEQPKPQLGRRPRRPQPVPEEPLQQVETYSK
ncbi:MAG TPA: Rne/Rng family ribonuclease [Azoarcus sp.]|nr:Rne/Rng family ribonuclease [Azoarcus sp.]